LPPSSKAGDAATHATSAVAANDHDSPPPAAGLALDDLFDNLGSGELKYAARCADLSGQWVELQAYVTRSHDDRCWMAVDQPGACPDCAPVPVAALQLPGFELPSGVTPDTGTLQRLRGQLSYGFAIGADGYASFLRLESAQWLDAEQT
jgi:hypothetical protein